MNSHKHRIRNRKDFTTTQRATSSAELCKDTNGHGTAVVYQLIKTCPDAHIYVAKVVQERHGDSVNVDRTAVANAIMHAARPVREHGWGVDIISMSFGWDNADRPHWNEGGSNASTASGLNNNRKAPTSISEAIRYATDQHVLLFAAATNYGLSRKNDIFYPARDVNVISVDSQDGDGNPASFAIQSGSGRTKDRFCAPGIGAANPLGKETLSGSSFACPIAAGIAALVLQFTRQSPLKDHPSIEQAVKNHQGMARVLRDKMSDFQIGREVFKILYPWKLFGLPADDEKNRRWAARAIVECLKNEYGEEVGNEIDWY
ncbi:peptidase S8/S53 domain-containing protein [Cercophora newfieldiana]|uniref:Peptidase S8/S53 domain-containing protein n=1 Tax=Cercophora newfieldiana TaxID=92897 RepID=A0AA39YE26_9PEZI|nr:peptidase S8/S53 domain-containing protein [Cercophora newfieldiana]